jgi:DNA-cytosine methyltransferase
MFRRGNCHDNIIKTFAKARVFMFIEDIAGMSKVIKTKKESIKAKAHPAHYMIHKYWARKPHNVIAEYITYYTKPGEVVLDPFMGSGVVAIESAKSKRQAIGIDINPTSYFIAKNTIAPFYSNIFENKFSKIFNKNYEKFIKLYQTKCPSCGKMTHFENSVWEKENIVRLRGICSDCGKFVKNADTFDIKIYKQATALFRYYDKKKKVWYPKDEILQFVKRSGKTHLNQLFTERALLVLGTIIKDINKTRNEAVKNLLLMCFTSMLPNVSKMIPGDKHSVNGKSGWVISKLWAPKVHTERNVLISFKQRYEKIKKGKLEIEDKINPKNVKLYNKNSDNLNYIKTESVDYIFTDPPYGSSIAYLGLSMFWNSWLKANVNYKDEIIYDIYRNKGYDDYARRMANVFSELYRVLKNKKFLSFTFHNRDLNIWKGVIDAVRGAGFHLKNIVYQEQAVSSGTQGINRRNTLRGDFIYNCYKDVEKKHKIRKPTTNPKEMIIAKVSKWIEESGGGISADRLYEKLIPVIVENDAYTDRAGKVIDIEKLLSSNFVYVRESVENKDSYVWQKKHTEINTKNSYTLIDLFAGAGGLSNGFKKAGFKIISAVEYDPHAAETYSMNHPDTKIFVDNITDIKSKDLTLEHKSVDLVIGGPPCQGFSMAGKRIRDNGSFLNDTRNELFQEFHRVVKDLNPKVFVMENVDAILSMHDGLIAKTIMKLFEDIGYDTKVKVLLAADYGVPQLRRRAFFIGNRLGINSEELFPQKTHGPGTHNKYITVKESIWDLPYINANEGEFESTYNKKAQSDYQISRRNGTLKLFNHQASKHDKKIVKILEMINEGEGRNSLPETLRTRSIHSGAFGRMESNKPSYTITTRFDTPSVGRVTHPNLNRALTPREAARIQSFDDDFIFYGNRGSIGKQIGNAVPPLLAYEIAKNVIKKLEVK